MSRVLQEMKEVEALALRDTSKDDLEVSVSVKNEMANCLHDMSETYEKNLDTMRTELETYYQMKVF